MSSRPTNIMTAREAAKLDGTAKDLIESMSDFYAESLVDYDTRYTPVRSYAGGGPIVRQFSRVAIGHESKEPYFLSSAVVIICENDTLRWGMTV